MPSSLFLSSTRPLCSFAILIQTKSNTIMLLLTDLSFIHTIKEFQNDLKLPLIPKLLFHILIFNSFLLLYPNVLILDLCLSAYSKAFVKIFCIARIRKRWIYIIVFSSFHILFKRKLHLIFYCSIFNSLTKSEEEYLSNLSHHH